MANEPDIIQKLSVDFNVVTGIDVDFNSVPQPVQVQTNANAQVNAEFNSNAPISARFNSNVLPLEAEFGTVYVVSGDCKVLYASTATWNSQPQLISARGYLYIYSDHKQDEHGQNIAGMKVGDGSAYLIDMPFTDDLLYSHIENGEIHITPEERAFWNNKVRCYVDPLNEENLIFSTQ